MALVAATALAQEAIDVRAQDDGRLTVTVRDALPADVLRELSAQLEFDLRMPETPYEEEPFSLSLTGKPGDLLPRLLPDYNLLMRSKSEAGGPPRLVQVIVLERPGGGGAIASRTEAPQQTTIPSDRVQPAMRLPDLTQERLQRAEQRRQDILQRLGRGTP